MCGLTANSKRQGRRKSTDNIWDSAPTRIMLCGTTTPKRGNSAEARGASPSPLSVAPSSPTYLHSPHASLLCSL